MSEAKAASKPKKKLAEGISRKDLLFIPFNHLEVEKDFNKRIDYGDIEELAESILQNGLKDPLVVQRGKNNKYYVRSGHRRYKAMQLLSERGKEVKKVPCEIEKKDLTPEQRYIDMVIYNDGMAFSMLELGTIFMELENLGFTPKNIQEKLGLKHVNKVYDGLTLARSPKKIHAHITGRKISQPTVLQIIKECSEGTDKVNWDKVNEMVEGAIKAVQKDPTKNDSPERIATHRHVKGLKVKTPIQRTFSFVERAEKNPDTYDMRKVAFLKEYNQLLKDKAQDKEILELLRKKK